MTDTGARVGFFTDSYFPGIDGVTYTIKAWRERLEERGHEVYIIYPASSHDPAIKELPVPSLPNPVYGQYRFPTYRRLSTLPELDVVHCHGPASTGLLGKRYAKKRGVKSVYTHHTPVEDYLIQAFKFESLSKLVAKLYVAYENRFLESFDCVTASTSRIRRNVEPRKLPVGIEMDTFQPRDERLFDAGGPLVGYSGRMTAKKNIDEILRLAERMPDSRFVLVGEGPERARLERSATENVTLRDFLPREKLPALYSSLDVFVTASTCDTLGLSTLEANACGTPVAAADVPPFDRTIGDENGSLFEYQDLDDMEQAVRDCLTGGRATRDAVERFAISNTIDELEEIYGVG
jgi:glycosyltransferase involved in cell wall biosynthesis